MRYLFPSSGRRSSRISNAFTLVEVAFATAVTALGIISLAVLFPLSLNSSHDATADLELGLMSRFILTELRNTPFDELQNADQNYLFGQRGEPVSQVKDATYHCRATVTPLGGTLESLTSNLCVVKLQFSRSDSVSPNGSRTLSATIARYASPNPAE